MGSNRLDGRLSHKFVFAVLGCQNVASFLQHTLTAVAIDRFNQVLDELFAIDYLARVFNQPTSGFCNIVINSGRRSGCLGVLFTLGGFGFYRGIFVLHRLHELDVFSVKFVSLPALGSFLCDLIADFGDPFDHGVEHVHVQRQGNASPAVPFGAVLLNAGRATLNSERVGFGFRFGVNRGHHGGVKCGLGIVVAGNGHERHVQFTINFGVGGGLGGLGVLHGKAPIYG